MTYSAIPAALRPGNSIPRQEEYSEHQRPS